jgi:hypothetical protein
MSKSRSKSKIVPKKKRGMLVIFLNQKKRKLYEKKQLTHSPLQYHEVQVRP